MVWSKLAAPPTLTHWSTAPGMAEGLETKPRTQNASGGFKVYCQKARWVPRPALSLCRQGVPVLPTLLVLCWTHLSQGHSQPPPFSGSQRLWRGLRESGALLVSRPHSHPQTDTPPSRGRSAAACPLGPSHVNTFLAIIIWSLLEPSPTHQMVPLVGTMTRGCY